MEQRITGRNSYGLGAQGVMLDATVTPDIVTVFIRCALDTVQILPPKLGF